jgi:Mg-chelatase subunit ChlI
MATKEAGSGDWTLEAGALVLADGGVCCIDEFDAIREHDRATIHEAMEQQTLSIAKAGLVCPLNTRTTVFAACNPKGKYDKEASLSTNVAMASPLLSRFDIVLVLLDQADKEWDKHVSTFILNEEEMKPEEESEEEEASVNDLWPFEKIQAYICHVKENYKPAIGRQAGLILKKYYRKQRQADSRVAARTTIRLLESLARLAQAHARLMSRHYVTKQDAIVAVIAVDASTHISPLLNIQSVLQSNFPEDPDESFQYEMESILTKLGLSYLIDEPEEDPNEGGSYDADDLDYDREIIEKSKKSNHSKKSHDYDFSHSTVEDTRLSPEKKRKRDVFEEESKMDVNNIVLLEDEDDDDAVGTLSHETRHIMNKRFETNGRVVPKQPKDNTKRKLTFSQSVMDEHDDGDDGLHIEDEQPAEEPSTSKRNPSVSQQPPMQSAPKASQKAPTQKTTQPSPSSVGSSLSSVGSSIATQTQPKKTLTQPITTSQKQNTQNVKSVTPAPQATKHTQPSTVPPSQPPKKKLSLAARLKKPRDVKQDEEPLEIENAETTVSEPHEIHVEEPANEQQTIVEEDSMDHDFGVPSEEGKQLDDDLFNDSFDASIFDGFEEDMTSSPANKKRKIVDDDD